MKSNFFLSKYHEENYSTYCKYNIFVFILQAKLSEKRFDSHKAANPFSTKAFKTYIRRIFNCRTFSKTYSAGDIPCRIDHGGAGINHVQWSTPPEVFIYI